MMIQIGERSTNLIQTTNVILNFLNMGQKFISIMAWLLGALHNEWKKMKGIKDKLRVTTNYKIFWSISNMEKPNDLWDDMSKTPYMVSYVGIWNIEIL